MCYNAITGSAPSYLSELLHLSALPALSALHQTHACSNSNASTAKHMAFAPSHTSLPTYGTISPKTPGTLLLSLFLQKKKQAGNRTGVVRLPLTISSLMPYRWAKSGSHLGPSFSGRLTDFLIQVHTEAAPCVAVNSQKIMLLRLNAVDMATRRSSCDALAQTCRFLWLHHASIACISVPPTLPRSPIFFKVTTTICAVLSLLYLKCLENMQALIG